MTDVGRLSVCFLILALCGGASAAAQRNASTVEDQTRSDRIHELLLKAKSYQATDDKIRERLQEVLGRQTTSFAEFRKQCTDLRAALADSDAMEMRKRQMLAELQALFRGNTNVQNVFVTLYAMEDESDKIEPIWRGMIACSGMLESAPKIRQDAYQRICVEPAKEQLDLVTPEVRRLGWQLQDEIQKYGASLPRDFLQAIGP
jgi:hypothetical protein